VIPFGTHTIHIVRFDPEVVSSREGNEHVPVWNHEITMDVFDGMINALCKSDMMKRFYQGKNCFDQKEIDKYVRGAERSGKRESPMDWVFDFSYDLSVPEYYVTHRECGVCKIGQQEKLEFLTPHMCVMDDPTIEYQGGKLLRTKTLGAGGDCCDFHVVKGDR